MSKFKHAFSNKVRLIYQFLCSPAHWVFPIYCFVQIVYHPSCYRQMNICTWRGGSCVAVITPLNNLTVRSGSNDSHISQKLWTKLIRWMDQLLEHRAEWAVWLLYSKGFVEEHWCCCYWRSRIQETNHYSGNNWHPNQAMPPLLHVSDYVQRPPRLVPATGLRTLSTATVAQVHNI